MVQIDRRTRRTLTAIRQAFITLLNKKEISKITVRDIAELADINRATFYLHYPDIYEVLEDIENEVAAAFFDLLDRYDVRELTKDPYPILKTLGEGLADEPEFSKFILKSATKSKYFLKIKTELKHRMLKTYDPEIAGELYYSLTFITAGALDTYEEWVEAGKPIPLETLCKNMSVLITSGFNSFLEKTKKTHAADSE